MHLRDQDGKLLFDTPEGRDYFENVRRKEVLWELFIDSVQTPCFTPAFECCDGVEYVRIWRVEP